MQQIGDDLLLSLLMQSIQLARQRLRPPSMTKRAPVAKRKVVAQASMADAMSST
jgi:hypothetical protein